MTEHKPSKHSNPTGNEGSADLFWRKRQLRHELAHESNLNCFMTTKVISYDSNREIYIWSL